MTQEHIKRKLSGILSADAVEYSRLMRENEASTVRNLEENQKLIFKLVEEYEGRVVDAPGDNILAEFSSVVKAVDCAVKIQKELKIKNAELVENRRMEFRIGINLGDVIEEEDRIYGDGVNIAARLEGLAQPGGICISRNVYDQVKTKLDLGYEYLGEHDVKNIAEPVRVYRVLMGAEIAGKVIGEKKFSRGISPKISIATIIILIIIAAGLLLWNIYSHKAQKIEPVSVETEQAPVVSDIKEVPKTIAVIPFVDLSPEKDQEYFVDGLSEELINCLTKIGDLRVIARTSSFAFKDTKKTVQEIADALGADHVLEGSVRKAGNELRITAQLIQAVDGIHLWSDTYDRELKDIFDVQEDIANSVADELKVTLGIDHSLRPLGGTDNVKAYEIYLTSKGMQYGAKGIQYVGTAEEGISIVAEFIDRAIALDPEFALAWSYKAVIYSWYVVFEPDKSRLSSLLDRGLNAAQRAIEIEPNLAAGYAALGIHKMFRNEWVEAELAYRKAFELTTEPVSVLVPQIPHHYMAVGFPARAKEFFEEIRQNDPLNGPNRGWYIYCLGLLGDTQGAEMENERCSASFGDQWFWGEQFKYVRFGSGDVVSRNELPTGELIIWDRVKEHFESPEEEVIELRRLYTDEENLNSGQLRWISIFAAYFGDPELAMDAIEKAHSLDPPLVHTLWFPKMREVRQLPRFKEFIREIGLVDYWNEFGWPDICRPLENGDFECD